GLRSAGLKLESMHALPLAAHLCWFLQSSDWLQSASEPTTQMPSFAVQSPDALQAAPRPQSAFVATMHFPSLAVHWPVAPHAIDCWQSALVATTHRHGSGLHNPVQRPCFLHGSSFLHCSVSSRSFSSRLWHDENANSANAAATKTRASADMLVL